jgi:pSer/pThr/pTyr-binding forkhead associated (FHA) protein
VNRDSGHSLKIIIAGIVAFLGVLILFFVLKGKRKLETSESEMRPDFQAPRTSAPMPEAKLIDPQKIVFEQPIDLNKSKMTIGRDSNNDIIIPKDTVSSLHAAIDYKDGYFALEDQRSSNGTRLNEHPIEAYKPIRLKSGDRLKFDIYEFTFFVAGQTPVGGTFLGGKDDITSGPRTVLRSSKSQERKPLTDEEAKGENAGSSPIPDAADQDSPSHFKEPDREKKTKLKPGMCQNHPSRRATELCMICKQAFCKKCMVEKGDITVCEICAQKI